MKKIIPVASFLTLTLLLTSCSWSGKLSKIQYNNDIVESVNEVSTALETTATLYNETIPDLVTEATEITSTEMQTSYDSAVLLTSDIDALLLLESKDIEQQNAVRPALETYQSAGTNYLESYAEMLEYYSSGTYQTDVTQVKTLDEALHAHYTTFIQANNDLVEVLESFVASSAE